MDELLLKRIAFQSVTFMILVITLSYALQRYQAITIEASNKAINNNIGNLDSSQTSKENVNGVSLEEPVNDNYPLFYGVMEEVDYNIIEQLGDCYLIIKKPEGISNTCELEDLFLTKSIRLTMTGLFNESLNSEMIGRVYNNEIFLGEPKYTETTTLEEDSSDGTMQPVITRNYGNDIVHGITIDTLCDNTYVNSVEVQIELNNVYVHQLKEDDNYYYIDLKNPRDVYDKILVIDAGHGGKDAGALSANEKFYEKDINLDILLQLKEMLNQENIKVYYTRLSDEKVYLRPRVELANAVDCDFFISIHCNASTVSSPNGTEILYYDTDFKGIKAKDLAQTVSKELGKTTAIKNRGLVQKKDNEIFILKNATVPAILIEVGYMTNNNDMTYLSREENRRAVAEGIYNGIMVAYETLMMEN